MQDTCFVQVIILKVALYTSTSKVMRCDPIKWQRQDSFQNGIVRAIFSCSKAER
jgi:hypothetical protein